MTIELRCPEDLDVLKKLQRQERNAKQRDRYSVVLLALSGKTAPEIASKLDHSRRFVQQWTYRHRGGGVVAPTANTTVMSAHLRMICRPVGRKRHVVLVVDQAG